MAVEEKDVASRVVASSTIEPQRAGTAPRSQGDVYALKGSRASGRVSSESFTTANPTRRFQNSATRPGVRLASGCRRRSAPRSRTTAGMGAHLNRAPSQRLLSGILARNWPHPSPPSPAPPGAIIETLRPPLAGARAQMLDTIFDEAQRMERLINNLLDMTRLESGGVTSGRREWRPLAEVIGWRYITSTRS